MHPLLKIDGCNCTRTDEDPVLRLGLILVFEYIRVINLKTRVYSKLEYLKSTSLYSSLITLYKIARRNNFEWYVRKSTIIYLIRLTTIYDRP